jgi:nucleoside-diphosphate-sugar epimerase
VLTRQHRRGDGAVRTAMPPAALRVIPVTVIGFGGWHHACMRILIIGGTAFVGRHISAAALAAGHEVTVFNRGRTGPDLFPAATQLVGDRNTDLSALESGQWDVTIDVCCYFPRQLTSLQAALGGRGGQYVFISSTSAYRTPVAPGFTEDAPLAELADPTTEEVTEETYGGLKVVCERLAVELFGPATTIVRPTYVIGPYDRTYRFTWWVERLARGGTVLAPGDRDDPIQVIDARDLASWIVSLASEQVTGIFHAVSPAPPFGFGDLLDTIKAAVAPPGTELVWVGKDFLLAEGETSESLPLWPGGDSESDINAADPAAAAAVGLRPRLVGESAAEVHAAEQLEPTPVRPGTGISAEREAELLARWHATGE